MYKLIIIDDEESARTLAAKCISKIDLGFEVTGSFSNGQKALEYLKENETDVVITDIKMPKMSGIELAKNIHEMMPKCKVIIISGYGEFDYAKKAIEYNVINYLLKPININELIDTLKRLKQILDKNLVEKENNLEMLTEQREQFFTDIFIGEFVSKTEIEKMFLNLKFPFNVENSDGAIIEINVKNYEQYINSIWKYGKANITTAILNIMQKQLLDVYIYPISQKKERFIFVLFNIESPVDSYKRKIEQTMKNVLNMDAVFNCLNVFDSIFNITCDEIFDSIEKEEDSLLTSHNIKEDIVIKKAKAYIDANYDKDITRDDVAEHVHFNSAYFSRYFKQQTGESFYDYLVSVKMRKAIELLSTKMKIYDICEKVGYKNIKYFSKNFKQYTSYTPSEYRKYVFKIEGIDDEE